MTKKNKILGAVIAGLLIFCLVVLVVRGRYFRAEPERQSAPDLNNTVSHVTPWPGETVPSSHVTVTSEGPVTAGAYTGITIIYIAGRGGVNTFGGIRAAFEHGADWGKLQTDDPKRDSYVTVIGPKGVKLRLVSDNRVGYCELVEAQVVKGKIKEGQTVAMILGDHSGGSKGLMSPTVSEVAGAGRIRIFEDRTGEGHFYSIPGIPDINIRPSQPHHLRIIARSWAIIGEPVNAVFQIEDKYNNVVTGFDEKFKITDVENSKTLALASVQKGLIYIKGITCVEAGIYRFRIQEVEGSLSAISNPIECVANAGAPKVFFGSIHNHTLLSDGLNTLEDATLYARDVSHLDFFATSDHAILPDDKYDHVLLRHNIDENQWKETASVVRKYNNPGSFVTFLAFEWSTKKYGDKNVYFFDDNAPYHAFPSTPQELYKSIEGERATVITHTMMGVTGERGPNWDLVDNRFEKVMEIASGHGVREYSGNNYPICENDKNLPVSQIKGNLAAEVLQRGLRLGFVAGSDDHSGKPGAGVKGIDACVVDGLVAVRASDLSRETIFGSIQNRATYATTGARILLSFSINGHNMGEEISLKKNIRRKIVIEVHGDAPVSEVYLIRENPTEPVKVWKWDTPLLDPGKLEWEDNSPLDASTWYYVRVIQSDNQMAWSSPIWLDLGTVK